MARSLMRVLYTIDVGIPASKASDPREESAAPVYIHAFKPLGIGWSDAANGRASTTATTAAVPVVIVPSTIAEAPPIERPTPVLYPFLYVL